MLFFLGLSKKHLGMPDERIAPMSGDEGSALTSGISEEI